MRDPAARRARERHERVRARGLAGRRPAAGGPGSRWSSAAPARSRTKMPALAEELGAVGRDASSTTAAPGARGSRSRSARRTFIGSPRRDGVAQSVGAAAATTPRQAPVERSRSTSTTRPRRESRKYNLTADTEAGDPEPNDRGRRRHLDSVEEGRASTTTAPAAATILEIAEQMAKARQRSRATRSASPGGAPRSPACVGSTAYVADLIADERDRRHRG